VYRYKIGIKYIKEKVHYVSMYLKKVITTYKGKTREYAQIVKSVRREDGKSSIEVVKSLC